MTRPPITHASQLRHRPAGPRDDATEGRWIVEHATRHPGPPPTTDRRQTVTWTLVLRHADDDHREQVDTNALTTTSYRPGDTVYGTVRHGMFRRARPHVGRRS